MLFCAAKNCNNKQGQGFALFRFPKEADQRRNEWIKGCEGTIIKQSSRLCQCHFDDSQFYTSTTKRLRSDAIPTIFNLRITNSKIIASTSTKERTVSTEPGHSKTSTSMSAVEATKYHKNLQTENHTINYNTVAATERSTFQGNFEEFLINRDQQRNPEQQNPEQHNLGFMDKKCKHCGALHFAAEAKKRKDEFNDCCNFGNVKLTPLKPYPIQLQRLLDGSDPHSLNFRKCIRNYNSSLAMASMGANIDTPPSNGPYCFRIHGQIYHRLGPLYPDAAEKPSYGQMYVLDSEMATTERLTNVANTDCIPSIMDKLHKLLLEINPYVASFRMMKEVFEEEEMQAILENRPIPSVTMIFDVSRNMDQRRYNAPMANEIAAVFVGEDGEVPMKRHIAVHARGGGFQQISHLNKSCDPLTYPILFPEGDDGWHTELLKEGSHRKRTRITQKEYYSYRFSMREEGFSAIHHSGKLFQQFMVDSYVKLEQNRLNYERTHQVQLRADSYRSLMDYIGSIAENKNATVGRRVILPSTYPGSPRAMQQGFQDTMAMVTKYGKPDIFVTFTCNPTWPEIKSQLLPQEIASDRPDVVARVFKLKLDALREQLLNKHILGHVIAHVSVIEFQKRGLPHCHLLLILSGQDKLRTPEQVDKLVSCQIPNPIQDAQLFNIVKKSMVHGPCGAFNPRSPCMQDGACTKKFPKPFCDKTLLEVNGYPQYKRCEQGNTLQIKNFTIDSRWIVPYNRYLTLKFNAHINVESCASVKSIKYLYKYIYKGHDRAVLKLKQNSDETGNTIVNYDEINAHLDARYVSAPEAAWRIFGFEMQNRSHTIYRLAVHLPDQQNVYFAEGEERVALEQANSKHTTLTAWFKLNELCRETFQLGKHQRQDIIDSRNYYYSEIPEHFVFNKSTTTWTNRKRFANEIGRMYTVGPHDVERYHLRLLLLHVKGAESFDDIKTVNGCVHSTFMKAAQEAGLLFDDQEYTLCLTEVASFQLPHQLRNMFMMLLVFCTVSYPLQLWQEFKTALSEDYNRGMPAEEAEATAYYSIAESMQICGRKLQDFISPPQIEPQLPALVDTTEIHQAEGERLYTTLNTVQKSACDEIINLLQQPPPRCIFIDGPGGSGKTYLYTTLNHMFKGRQFVVVNVAWSGIAATLLSDGRTVHSRFKLPVPINKTSFLSAMKVNSPEAEFLRSSDVIIWDEAPMAPKYALESVNLLLMDIMGNQAVFGGKLMVLGGDFRQVLPVVRQSSRADCIDSCLKRSELWAYFKVIQLTANMRAAGEDEWSALLLEIGDGKVESDDDDNVVIPEKCISSDNLIADIYGEQILPGDVEGLCDKVILTPRNTDSLDINERVLQLLAGNTQIYKSIDEAVCDESEGTHFPTEFLNSLTPSGMPPHELHLKIGAIVMLLRNIDIKNGLCNGTRLIVQHMGRYVLGCVIAFGANKGKYVLIPRISLSPSDTNLPFVLKRRQFPIRLSFAMTINKAQGQTFTKVGLYLNTPVFSHGQLYVAFSRVKAIESLKVLIKDGTRLTKNIVYREIL